MHVGDRVRVVYDPEDPTTVEKDVGWYYAFPTATGAVGVGLALATALSYRKNRRKFPGWAPLSAAEVVTAFSTLHAPWWVTDSYSIERAAGRAVPEHKNIAVLMLRRDHMLIQQILPGWEWWTGIDTLGLWPSGQRLSMFDHEIWCRSGPASPWRLKIMLAESAGADWLPFRGARLRKPIAALGLPGPDGVPYLTPEIQLFYSAKKPGPQDDAEFAAVLPHLTEDQRWWLDDALAESYGHRHPWRNRLRLQSEPWKTP